MAGNDAITVDFMGDGTLGEGAVYETLNLASKWELPLLIVLENNQYSQSTRQVETLAGDICARAAAFGISTRHSNTWGPAQLVADVGQMQACAVSECKPVFLRVYDSYRLAAHSKGDDDRNPDEIATYRARDPLAKYIQTHPSAAEAALRWASVVARLISMQSLGRSAPHLLATAGCLSRYGGLRGWQLVSWSAALRSPRVGAKRGLDSGCATSRARTGSSRRDHR